MLGWASSLTNRHYLLIEFLEGKVDKPAEEVMLEHLSYRYENPERFSSLALTHGAHRGVVSQSARGDGSPAKSTNS